MHVRILGSAAGGGLPQWNCNCDNCMAARAGVAAVKPRTQSCVAVSGDGVRWFLINASPDLRSQIESFSPLWPKAVSPRGSGVSGVLLTNADLDHTLGLLLLREGGRLALHATTAVQRSLQIGLNLDSVLGSYCGVEWREPSMKLTPLLDGDGLSSGLRFAAFAVPGKPPRYRADASPSSGDAVGYRITDEKTGGRLVVIPDAAAINDRVAAELSDCDLLFFDGTFFDEDELQRICPSASTASEMGHVPIGGIDGSLARLAPLQSIRVYVHINNTNPILSEDSPQRASVDAAGIIVGEDGMDFSL